MTHHSHRPEDLDWDQLGATLEREADLHGPALDEIAGWLPDAPEVRSVLDVGSGPGRVACRLAERFPGARITAVDGSAELLTRARDHAARTGVQDRFRTRQAQLPAEFPDLEPADLVWSSKAVHHLGDQQAALRALADLVNPGGLLVITEGGLGTRFLPRDFGLGRPGLQARLDVLMEERFAAMRASLPGTVSVVEDWPAMLDRAGLTPTGSRTFLVDRPAPLDASGREHVRTLLGRLAEQGADSLDDQDRATLTRLLDPEAADGIQQRADVFYLTAMTVHTARASA